MTWQVFTFGCPYLGNHEFARDYAACVPDTWHIMNERDTVTRVGKFLFLFKRPGCVLILDHTRIAAVLYQLAVHFEGSDLVAEQCFLRLLSQTWFTVVVV